MSSSPSSPSTDPNSRQVGGNHYRRKNAPQHWDLAIMYQWDPFQYQVTKYVMRWKDKNGIQDLEKAAHFLEKYIEAAKAGAYIGPESKPAPEPHPYFSYKVNPTGWVGFTFEGADSYGFHFRCKTCLVRFYVGENEPPMMHHTCELQDPAEPTSAYTNQG
jgi:hypothetical protein